MKQIIISILLFTGFNVNAQLISKNGKLIDSAGYIPNAMFTSKWGLIDDASLAMESTTFGTNNTTKMQRLLDSATNHAIVIYVDGHYSATQLQIRSNTKIITLPGCGFIQRDNTNLPFVINYGRSGGASSIVSNNIEISGGIWNGNGQRSGVAKQTHDGGTSGTGWNCIFRFSGVKNLIIKDVQMLNARTMSCFTNNCNNVVVKNFFTTLPTTLAGTANYDGLKFVGPSSNITVSNLYGRVKDDILSFCANDIFQNVNSAGAITDGSTYDLGCSVGDITDFSADNISLDSTSYLGIRLLSTDKRLDRGVISNVHGYTRYSWLIMDNYSENPTGAYTPSGIYTGNFGTITFRDINVQVLSGGYKVAWAYVKGNFENLTFENYLRTIDGYTAPSLLVDSSYNMIGRNLNISYTHNVYRDSTVKNLIALRGKIDKVDIRNSSVTIDTGAYRADIPLVAILSGGFIKHLNLSNVQGVGNQKLINMVGGYVSQLQVSNPFLKNYSTGTQSILNSGAGTVISEYILSGSNSIPAVLGSGTVTTATTPPVVSGVVGQIGLIGTNAINGTGALSVNTTSKFLGIGNTPAVNLDIAATVSGGSYVRLFQNPSNDAGYGVQPTSTLASSNVSWNAGFGPGGSGLSNGYNIWTYDGTTTTPRVAVSNTGNLLIGTVTNNSKLTVNGSFATGFVQKSTSYTATINDYTIEVIVTGQTITLPTAASIAGRIYTIKLTVAGSCTVATTSSQVIDASTTYSLSAQYKYVAVQSNGSNWLVISNN